MDNGRKDRMKRSVICRQRETGPCPSELLKAMLLPTPHTARCATQRQVRLERARFNIRVDHWRHITEGAAQELDGWRQTQEVVCYLDADISLCFSNSPVIRNYCYKNGPDVFLSVTGFVSAFAK